MLEDNQSVLEELSKLYESPFPSSRTGILYNAFSYPTKISPEAIAIFIASHTNVGDSILDTFAGSGTTGLATMLCDCPTPNMMSMADEMGVKPTWGARHAHLYEIGTLGAFVSEVLCNPPNPGKFLECANTLIDTAQSEFGDLYQAIDPSGNSANIRYIIWSDVLSCPICQFETSFWHAAARRNPLELKDTFICSSCCKTSPIKNCNRVTEVVKDYFAGTITRKKRVPVWLYGSSGTQKWDRAISAEDVKLIEKVNSLTLPRSAPNADIVWGDLHRSGYHTGITKLNHFYTSRNFYVMSKLWDLTESFDDEIKHALKLLVLSYNSSHSTLMTRVVLKKNQKDFVLTGAQSGVLYISGLPVEKNIISGVARKVKTFTSAFKLVYSSRSKVKVYNASSEKIDLDDQSINYVFTDPPFGAYIPYAELNQINEHWLKNPTKRESEIIVSRAQGKDISNYSLMMKNVFSEIHRVLMKDGLATVVFHSAHTDIWKALIDAYSGANLTVVHTSILDKFQSSFKQVVSKISVKGDPLILLKKDLSEKLVSPKLNQFEICNIDELRKNAPDADNQRLYSMYITKCIDNGQSIKLSAQEFFRAIEEMTA